MGIREWSNNHPKATGLVVGACVLGCGGALVAEVLSNRHTINDAVPTAYYTADDGKTYFVSPITNVPPFDYEGKTAVRANVFDCGGTKFVGYLDRYTPEAKAVLLKGGQVPEWVDERGRELKKPGDAKWVSAADMAAAIRISTVNCPNGSTDRPEPIQP